jgi:hypothetical protein
MNVLYPYGVHHAIDYIFIEACRSDISIGKVESEGLHNVGATPVARPVAKRPTG